MASDETSRSWVGCSTMVFCISLRVLVSAIGTPQHVDHMPCDTPLNSLMDSITNPKVTTTKGERVGARSLARSISEVEGHVGAPR
jgi:hypothetical protein